MTTAPATGVERFRELRRQLETDILPLGTSVDGRRFTFQASLHGLELRLGGYVMLDTGSGNAFGQILDLQMETLDAAEVALGDEGAPLDLRARLVLRRAVGEGAILSPDAGTFHDALVRPATIDEVRAWADGPALPRAPLEVGEFAVAPGVPLRIEGRGFDRHTFLCGQSGSGKTYSLGVMLERLLTDTGLRIVILDPNSDFKRLSDVRDGVEPDLAERYRAAAAGVAVHSAHAEGPHRLRLRIAELDAEAQAALLRLDPVTDREEYAELASILAEGTPPTVEAMEASGKPERHQLAMRARNLGLEDYAIWARGDAGSVLDAVRDPAQRVVVVDLGSLPTREEQALTAAAVLGDLWARREERQPILIVIDEAHNVCPGSPPDALTALAAETCVRIAAEGRKFGLYLLVSTQRPQKVQENVLSQCDNLVLMRLNSRADAAFAAGVFSFVPASLIQHAVTFGLGEALVAGKVAPWPALLRFGRRVSQEGGSDVPATWAVR